LVADSCWMDRLLAVGFGQRCEYRGGDDWASDGHDGATTDFWVPFDAEGVQLQTQMKQVTRRRAIVDARGVAGGHLLYSSSDDCGRVGENSGRGFHRSRPPSPQDPTFP